MDELLLIEAVERYLKGEMTSQERAFFEDIRKNNPAVDQMVVEHTFLLNELDKQANIKAFKHTLYEVENKLTEEGIISKKQLTGKAKVVFLCLCIICIGITKISRYFLHIFFLNIICV